MNTAPMLPLQAVAAITREIVEPGEIRQGALYVGLENIESGGKLVDVRPIDAGELASSKFAFTKKHVLFGKLRPYLAKVARPDFEGICSTDILPVMPGPKLDRRYLQWFLLTPEMVKLAAARSTGANLPRLSPSALQEMMIPVPSLSEQQRIADILDKADALRAKRRAAVEKLNALKKAIFFDLFGDPVANPKRWHDRSLGAVMAETQYGPRFFNEQYSSDGVRIVRITDLNANGDLDFSAMPRMSVSEADLEQYRLRPGDLIFARSGATVGKVAVVKDAAPECIAGAYFIRIRLSREVLPEYAADVLSTASVRRIVDSQSRQAAQQNFSGPGLRRLPMPVPPFSLQLAYREATRAIDLQRTTQKKSLSELDALLASLQHSAFRGELTA